MDDFLGLETRMTNPAVKTYKWKAGKEDNNEHKIKLEERLTYYDKETEENIAVPIPFEFIIIGIGMSATGVRKEKVSGKDVYTGLYSNEVRWNGNWDKTVAQQITLKGNKEVVDQGSLKEVLARNEDAKKAISLYILNPESKQIERILMQGAAASVALSMLFGSNEYKNFKYSGTLISIADEEKDKSGSVVFFKPVIKYVRDLTPEEKADIKDNYVSDITDYLANVASSVVSATRDGKKEPVAVGEARPEGEIGDEPIDLSDIPF